MPDPSTRLADLSITDAANEFRHRTAGRDRHGAARIVWRIGTAAAVVLAVIAVVLLVRALIVPATTEVSVRAVATGAPLGPASMPPATADPPSARSAAAGAPSTNPAPSGTAPSDRVAGGDGRVVVHVAGAVRRPGVVRLAAGSRVADAVTAAGGALPGARLEAVNLAARAEDGTQIRVPAAGDESAAVPGPASASSPDPAAAAPGMGAPVNINTADAAGLDTLPRVGPVLAQRIVAWRTEQGPFGSVDDLDAVPGIGEKMMAELRPLVTIG